MKEKVAEPKKVTVPKCFTIGMADRDLIEVGRAAIVTAFNQAAEAGLNTNQRLWMTVPITIEIGLSPKRSYRRKSQPIVQCTGTPDQFLWCLSLDGFSWGC